MKITNEIIESYYDCPYKAYLKLQGLHGQKCNFEKLLFNELHERKRQFCKKKLNKTFTKRANFITKSNPLANDDCLVNVEIRHENFALNCDVIKKMTVRLAEGKFYYIPTIILNSEKVSKKHKIVITALSYVLNKTLGSPIDYGIIIFSSGFISTKVRVSQHLREFKTFLDRISGSEEPQFRLNSHCPACEFSLKCRERAIREDHLSLLRGMGPDKLKKLNKKGIFTVNQLSYTFRPKRKSLIKHQRNSTRSFELQALAIREKKIFVYDIPDELPRTSTEIYLDVEGLPDRSFHYLIGLTIKTANSTDHYSFWLNDQKDSREVLHKFLTMLQSYDEFVIYHYGTYEVEFLQSLKRINAEFRDQIDGIIKKCINILSLLYSHIYFPTHSNGLKEIGRFIGFTWTDEKSSGIESIFWRRKWELTGLESLKQKLLIYNEEDCKALMTLKSVMANIIGNNTTSGLKVGKVSDLLRNRRATFVVNQSFFPEMKFINKCAYFDYQREKVYSKNKSPLSFIKHPGKRKTFFDLKPNKTITIEANNCENCRSKKLVTKKQLHRKIGDLKFTVSGVRRFVIQYYSKEYYCKKCKTTFIPEGYPSNKFRTGHNLMVWGIFQHIVSRQSFRFIEENLNEVFGVFLSKTTFFAFKSYFVKYYESTFINLKNKVINSSVLYVDETPFTLQFTKGYVWVLTNGHEAVSIYRPTREASFIKDFLKDFRGVLVTDFYSGYDALTCPQQRCLIHLIRDFNSDLIRNPFNDEFKEIAKSFTTLLQQIVGTIDRFGLKRHYLNKYKKAVNAFLLKVSSTTYKTEVAQQYQIRLKRNEDKLFQFLYHDNVSWNNNNAEHVIKILAMHANKDMNAYRETRIDDYLKIMSIYQTCKLRNISFLKFLLSKKKTIDEYLGK
jgi:predicted RecB family nuclease